jgi:Xaa-Pro aminopeptidase
LTISEWPICACGFSEPLQAGMTMALEPKIGLPGIGMVGIENTYEITKNGAVSLTGKNNDIICV